MRVVYDGAIFSMQRVGGISRYFSALFNYLPDDVDASLLAMSGSNLHLDRSYPRLRVLPILGTSLPKLMSPVQRWLDRKKVNRIDAGLDAEIAHWTYYVGLQRRPVQRKRGCVQVVTVYDLIHEIFPETDRSGREVGWKRQALNEADLIICISETTLRDLKNWYPDVASRAIAIPLGNPIEGVTAAAVPPHLCSRPFVLFVGGRSGYKNFGVVASAWQEARQRHPQLQLVLVGSKMKAEEVARWRLSNAGVNLHQLGHVDDNVLAGLYRAAAAFVFPSKYEGFGLPAVEAMSCSSLLLAATGGSLPEVIGTGGVFFDPDSSEQLASLLCDAVDGASYLSSVRKDGLERSKLYSWKSTAAQTYAAYRDAIQTSGV